MPPFTVEEPDAEECGIRVVCEDHDEATEFQPAERTVPFYCAGVGYEIELPVHEWRDLGERF